MPKPKILIIEDDPHQLFLYSKEFEIEGFEVSSAATGAEGIEKAEQITPDLILLDLVMPGLSGFQVLEKIKDDRVLSLIPVIVFTNLSRKDLDQECFRLGAKKVILKANSTPRQLMEQVRTVLNSPV